MLVLVFTSCGDKELSKKQAVKDNFTFELLETVGNTCVVKITHNERRDFAFATPPNTQTGEIMIGQLTFVFGGEATVSHVPLGGTIRLYEYERSEGGFKKIKETTIVHYMHSLFEWHSLIKETNKGAGFSQLLFLNIFFTVATDNLSDWWDTWYTNRCPSLLRNRILRLVFPAEHY